MKLPQKYETFSSEALSAKATIHVLCVVVLSPLKGYEASMLTYLVGQKWWIRWLRFGNKREKCLSGKIWKARQEVLWEENGGTASPGGGLVPPFLFLSTPCQLRFVLDKDKCKTQERKKVGSQGCVHVRLSYLPAVNTLHG